MNITDTFLSGLLSRSQALHTCAIAQAKRCLLDYLGVVSGGARYLKEVHPEFIEAFGKDTGASCVFGSGQKTTIANATLLNGFAAHVLELDDGHRHGMIHLGASIVTAVLASAERNQLSNADILRGIVLGYEAAVRCARAIQPGHKMRGYHVSGTCGTIGSAMGVAFACGYDLLQLKATLACAVSSAAGVLEIQEESSEMKPFNVGRAAMDGVVAALIGRLSMPGPDDVLGGKRGFLAAMTDTPHPEMLTGFAGDVYAIEGIYQKVHAACRHCHPAIDAALDLRNDLRFGLEDVDRIEVHTYKLGVGSHDHTVIKGISSAKLSTPYAVALAIVKGSAGYADYTEDNLNDYWIKSITRRVKVIEDEELTQRCPEVRGARVTIYMKDGGVFEAQCIYPKGEPENPLKEDELEGKFKGLAMYGGLSQEQCDIIVGTIRSGAFTMNTINQIYV